MEKRWTGANDVTLLYLCFITVIVYAIAPIVSRLFSAYLSTYAYMVIVVLTFVMVVFGKRIASLNSYLGIILPFVTWQLLTLIQLDDSLAMWGYSVLLELTPIIIGIRLSVYPTNINQLSRIIVYAFVITGITTVIGLVQYPDAARWLATAGSSQSDELILYDMHNIGGYAFIYSSVLMYPLLIFAYKQKRIKFIWAAFCTVLLGVVIYLSGYTTALLLFMITSCLYLVKRNLKASDVFVLMIIAVVAYLLFTTVFSSFFLRLSRLTTNENMAERLESLAGGYDGVKDSESNRIELYTMSLTNFFEHPLVGNMITKHGTLGGHSFIFDFLGQYGLVGLFLLISMYKKIFRVFYAPYKGYKGYGFIVWTFIQAIMLSMVNTDMWLYVLTLFVPIVLMRLEGGDGENEDSLDSERTA